MKLPQWTHHKAVKIAAIVFIILLWLGAIVAVAWGWAHKDQVTGRAGVFLSLFAGPLMGQLIGLVWKARAFGQSPKKQLKTIEQKIKQLQKELEKIKKDNHNNSRAIF